jgi:hypothetical protein
MNSLGPLLWFQRGNYSPRLDILRPRHEPDKNDTQKNPDCTSFISQQIPPTGISFFVQ